MLRSISCLLVVTVIESVVVAGCGSKAKSPPSDPPPSSVDFGNPNAGAGAASGAGASGAGTAGSLANPGTGGAGGSGAAGAAGATMGAMGTQPIGSACANDGNCSQAAGKTVCCVNTCKLAADCPATGYLACTSAADCSAYGGGKVCCDANGMRFCTKPSACNGQQIP